MAKAESIETRLQRVEDELAIRRVINDYAKYLDSRDYDGYVSLFAKDGGTWSNPSGTYKGAAAIHQMLVNIMGPPKRPNNANYHITSNFEVDVDGDRATAVSRWLFIERGPDGAPTPTISGLYRDEFVREDGKWKFKHRVAENLMPSPEDRQKREAAKQAKK
jgi:ketosteroid isomerase-like protein